MPKSQFDIVWRDQNAVASKAVQRRLKASEKPHRDRSTKTELARPCYHDVPRVMPQDCEDYALNFFFTSYILLPKDSNIPRGFLDCVYPIWTQASPVSPLRPAVNAVALCLLEAWSRLNPNSPQSLARSHYVQGIAAVRRRLQSSEKINDDVLMAILMLDMYDGVTSFCASRPHISPHVTGARALIENRRRLAFNSEISQRILLGVRSLIVERALSKREAVSEDVLDWTICDRNIFKSPGFELEEIHFEVVNLRASASGLSLMLDPAKKDSFALEILAKANELDQRLVAWTSTIPDDWIPTYIWDPECIPQSVRDAGLYQAHCTVHKSIFIADILNGQCGSRIKVQLVILACLEQLGSPFFDTTRVNARNNVQDLADTICASVPYHLGDRVEVLRFDDKTVQYPRIESNATPTEHYDSAAAYTGFFLTRRLSELLQPGLPLRAGQCKWILGQMQRIKSVYLTSPHHAS
ncbi:hypothetical protein MMC12_004667 [Toensbergia leucococca]|nr:hypothetical protein [Toensbergia leucococca]